MSAPRLEIDLDKLYHNASILVARLGERGIAITAVTKATMGSAEVASVWLQAGIRGLGESRIENIEALRRANVTASITLIRTPMLSQVEQVVALSDVSLNSELQVIRQLSLTAQKMDRRHGVILMVELGDLREGLMPGELKSVVREVLQLPNIEFKGIGTNLACRSGVSPDAVNMGELSALADSMDAIFGPIVQIVSGGNSANLDWALSGAGIGRINDLRMGEALLLGCEPLHRQPIEGLHTDAFTLVAEVIETNIKPAQPRGKLAQSAFGKVDPGAATGSVPQSICAVGRQDVDPSGLAPPSGIEIMATSSDHLIVKPRADHEPLAVGSEMSFQLNYSALLRAMTSPFVTKDFIGGATAGLPGESERSSRA